MEKKETLTLGRRVINGILVRINGKLYNVYNPFTFPSLLECVDKTRPVILLTLDNIKDEEAEICYIESINQVDGKKEVRAKLSNLGVVYNDMNDIVLWGYADEPIEIMVE